MSWYEDWWVAHLTKPGSHKYLQSDAWPCTDCVWVCWVWFWLVFCKGVPKATRALFFPKAISHQTRPPPVACLSILPVLPALPSCPPSPHILPARTRNWDWAFHMKIIRLREIGSVRSTMWWNYMWDNLGMTVEIEWHTRDTGSCVAQNTKLREHAFVSLHFFNEKH